MNILNDKPFFSIVIPTYERPNDLSLCLQSLDNFFQSSAKEYEIIVSDDSKSDTIKDLVDKQFPKVHWGKGKRKGPAGTEMLGRAEPKANGSFS